MKNFFIDKIEENRKSIKQNIFVNIENSKEVKTLNYDDILFKAKEFSRYLIDNKMKNSVAVVYLPADIKLSIILIGCLYADVTPIFKTISDSMDEEKFNYEFDQTLKCIDVADLIICDKNRLNLKEKCKLRNLNFINFENKDDDLFIHKIEKKKKICDLIITTSGTTNSSKAVKINYDNLKHCLDSCVDMWDMNDKSINFCWAPHSHVLGLVTGYLVPLYIGCKSLIISPKEFSTNPKCWLEIITKYKVTTCSTTLFGLELCNKIHKELNLDKLSLSSLEYVAVGGELVKNSVLNEFVKKFSSIGFDKKMFSPSYGMTENSGVVSSVVKSDKYISLKVDSEKLKQGYFVPCKLEGNDIVSVGKAPNKTEVYILDEDNNILPEGQIGEIVIYSPGLTSGYLKEEQNEMFQRVFKNNDKVFFKTGDCGALYEKQIFITGRIKEIINLKGKKYSPYDIENCILDKTENKLKSIAVFSVGFGDKEKVICFTALVCDDDSKKIKKDIKEIVKKYFNITMHDIIFMKVGEIPRTESKKIRRQICKEVYIKKYMKGNNKNEK